MYLNTAFKDRRGKVTTEAFLLILTPQHFVLKFIQDWQSKPMKMVKSFSELK